MLQKLILHLTHSPGIAEFVFPHLGEIRKQNSIRLLEKASAEDDRVHQLWEKVCHYLEKLSTASLSENYTPLTSPLHNHLNLCLLRNHVLNLHGMYVPEWVWEKYRDLRHRHLESYSCPCPVAGGCFDCCLKLVVQCLYEDEFVTYVGCFHPFIVTQSNILETYADVLSGKFHALLGLLEECTGRRKDLPQELVSLLRTSRASHERHAGTCFGCFMQSRIDSDTESGLHCIGSHYGTESVWASVFVSCVIKVVEAILTFEDKIRALFHKQEARSHTHGDDLSVLLEGSKLVLATESPEQSPFSKPQKKKSMKKLLDSDKITLLWNWRSTLVERGYLSHLQRYLQKEVGTLVKTLVEKERAILGHQPWRDLVSWDAQFSSESVETRTLLRSVLCTVQALERHLPVLSTACDSFLPFRSSFHHTLESYVDGLVRHLREVAGHTGEVGPVPYEMVALNNALFLRDRLQGYCSLLGGSVCGSRSNICQSLSQLADELMDSTLLHQFRYVSCGILLDADSHHFEDPKPFFEGERISFSVQMWNLHMKGLLHDLALCLPQRHAQHLYSHLLSSSLEHLLGRYSAAAPTEARTPQVVRDLYSLLLCASDLLWPACPSASLFVGRRREAAEDTEACCIGKAHSSCCLLLAVLVVLGAPTRELCGAFRGGFPQARLSVRTKYESVSPWLPWVRRELFSDFCQRQVVSNVSVWLAVRACTAWSVPHPASLVQAYTEHNCTLSILLMTQAGDPLPQRDGTLEGAEVRLAHSLLTLLICYDNHAHLQDILLPVIEKTHGWQEFDSSAAGRSLSQRPWWYRGLVRTLQPYIIGVFEEVLPVWLDHSKECRRDPEVLKSFGSLREVLKGHIVCVCEKGPLNSMQDGFQASGAIASFVCLRKVLESMHRNIVLLPQALKLFLASFDLHISNYVPEIQSVHHSLPLQVLLSSAIDFLRDDGFVASIPPSVRKMCAETAIALESIVSGEEPFFVDDHCTKIITMLLSSIHANFKELRQVTEKTTETMQGNEIKDEILDITVHKLLQMPQGSDVILHLHRILRGNEAWIQRSLGIPGMLSPDMVVDPLAPSPLPRDETDPREVSSPKETSSQAYVDTAKGASLESGCRRDAGNSFTNFYSPVEEAQVLNLEGGAPEAEPHFSPLDCFERLGESTFKQVALEPPPLQWEAILSHLPVLGLTEVNFRALLSHRWDLRNEGPLTPEELACVEELRAVYKITQ